MVGTGQGSAGALASGLEGDRRILGGGAGRARPGERSRIAAVRGY